MEHVRKGVNNFFLNFSEMCTWAKDINIRFIQKEIGKMSIEN